MSPAPRAFGGPPASGELRRAPGDFEVTEVMGFEPDGRGQHVWLWVAKSGANTADVARALAAQAGVAASAVGFAGRKDHSALTRQWFSVDLAGRDEPGWTPPADGSWWIEAVARHGRKLRPGTHRANRFHVRVRDVDGDRGVVSERLRAIAGSGFPNYFGAQRFGRGRANLAQARRALTHRRRRPPAMAISAARGWLFNRVLAQRVAETTWNRPLVGEAVMLAGTRSVFIYDGTDPTVTERAAALDIDPTGPLWGRGRPPLDAVMAECERSWLADEIELRATLERLGARAERRPLRTPAEGLDWRWDGDDLVVVFTLRRGAFATSLLAEVVDWGEDATPA